MILETPSIRTGREIRRLHDTVQQHMRALKAMDCEPSGPFITCILELKLNASTNFEWQKFSQDLPGYPHDGKLLEFLNLRAQASEASTKKSYNLCVNCLHPGHFVKQCRSSNRCRKCQKSHHTLLHVDQSNDTPLSPTPSVSLTSNTSPETTPGSLLMTCRVLLRGPDGSSIESRALLDSAFSISFVSERLAQALRILSHDFVEMPRYMVSRASPMTLIVSLSLTLLFFPCRNLPRRSM